MENKEKSTKKRKETKSPTNTYEKGMFSLKARARDKYGNLVWNS